MWDETNRVSLSTIMNTWNYICLIGSIELTTSYSVERSLFERARDEGKHLVKFVMATILSYRTC